MNGQISIPASIEIPAFEISDERLTELRALTARMETAIVRLESAITGQEVSFSEEEAAGKLGVSEKTLKRIRGAGLIAYSPVGRKPRYTIKHLSDYLERITQPETAGKNKKAPKSANSSRPNSTYPKGTGELNANSY